MVPFPTIGFTKVAFLVISVLLTLESAFFCVLFISEIFVVLTDNLVLSAWDDQHSRKTSVFLHHIVSTEWGWRVGKDCYIFSILVFILADYFTAVKFNIIWLKPKTSESLRRLWHINMYFLGKILL